MLCSRNSLPIFAVKTHVVDQIRNNEVVVISGETGSGKTTQVMVSFFPILSRGFHYIVVFEKNK
jgi:HrpA-like RNA helicase